MLWPSKLPEAQRPNGAVEVMDATDVFSLVAMDIYIYNIHMEIWETTSNNNNDDSNRDTNNNSNQNDNDNDSDHVL